jgi:predicted ATP-grasp superfamily ATP-dependent carboligase
VQILTTWDVRLGTFPLQGEQKLSVRPAGSPHHEAELLNELAEIADAMLIVAPELYGVLEDRCRQFAGRPLQSLNCAPDAIGLCANKWRFFEFCEQQGCPTVPSSPVENQRMPWQPCVVKRRDGAGSFQMQLVRTPLAWEQLAASHDAPRYLAQPWIVGSSLSVAGIYERGTLRQLFPIAEQRISVDQQFQYLGGAIPAPVDTSLCEAVEGMMFRIGQAIPGLHGYVGADFLLPQGASVPLLVEVNPRLTTSYVGYRGLSDRNLAAWLIDPGSAPGPIFRGGIRFTADGQQVERFE